MRTLIALLSACMMLMSSATTQIVDRDSLKKVSYSRQLIGENATELIFMQEVGYAPSEELRNDQDKLYGMIFQEVTLKSSRTLYNCQTGQWLDNDMDFKFRNASETYYLGRYEKRDQPVTSIVQCVYSIPVQEEIEADALYSYVAAWITSELMETPFCTNDEETAIYPAGDYFAVPTGLAFAGNDESLTCGNFSQWLGLCHGDSGVVLTDCAELLDADGNVSSCRVAFTWFMP